MAGKKTNNSDKNVSPDNPQMSLEEAFAALDELLTAMDDEKLSLEDSFKDYKKGLDLIRICNDSIGNIEGELKILEGME